MTKIIDLTPKHFPIIPAKEKIELPMSLKDDVDLVPLLGGSRIGASETIRGAGNKILKIGEKGIWLGNANFEDAPFKVDMNGIIEAKRLTLKNFINDDDPSIVYTGTWTQENVGTLYGGTRTISNTVGDYFTISFFGISIGLIF